MSKINPQKDDGHRQINTDVLAALIKHGLTGSEYKVSLFILHKTWGFQKKSDAISVSQMIEGTGLSDRMIRITIKSLRDMRIIHYEPSKRVNRGSALNAYLFNKHYDTWIDKRLQSRSGLKQNVGKPETDSKKSLNQSADTIDTLTKETKQKKEDMPTVKKPKSDHQKAVDYWHTQYLEKVGTKFKWADKQFKAIKDFLKDSTVDQFRVLADILLTTNDKWYSVNRTPLMLYSKQNELAQILKQAGQPQMSERSRKDVQAANEYLERVKQRGNDEQNGLRTTGGVSPAIEDTTEPGKS